MSTDLLVRKPIEAPVAVDNDEQRFAQDCWDKLGYDLLKQELTSQVNRPLGQVLRELQIEPFDLRGVENYKTDRAQSMSTDWMCGIPAAVWFVVAIGVILWAGATHGVADFLLISAGSIIGWFVASVASILAIGTFTKTAKWYKQWLPGYGGRVPEFALQTALDIRAKCPGAQYFIDELRSERISHDPFLLVELNNEQYYIEIWNEPSFKAPREI